MTTSALAAVRYRVAAFTVALAFVTYLDRVCISKLAGPISQDLGLSMQQMGYVFSSFTLAYAIFEVPTARWADKLGARVVLTRIVIWWSIFTMVTARCAGHEEDQDHHHHVHHRRHVGAVVEVPRAPRRCAP